MTKDIAATVVRITEAIASTVRRITEAIAGTALDQLDSIFHISEMICTLTYKGFFQSTS